MTTAGEIRDALMGRWSPAEYAHVYEAPEDAARQGRKIDVLVLSLWRSRGHELDAVEIKVTPSDWKRELDNAAKADWWWRHVNRFWMAVPAEMAERVKADLPSTWGLLALSSGQMRLVQKAPAHTPEPMPWPTIVGVIRASADCGVNALARAEANGFERGRAAARRDAEKVEDASAHGHLYEELKAQVTAFEELTGLRITANMWNGGAHLAADVNLVRNARAKPVLLSSRAANLAAQVRDVAGRLDEVHALLNELTRPAEAVAGDS